MEVEDEFYSESYSSVNTYVKDEVDVNIDGSVYGDVDRSVGDEIS